MSENRENALRNDAGVPGWCRRSERMSQLMEGGGGRQRGEPACLHTSNLLMVEGKRTISHYLSQARHWLQEDGVSFLAPVPKLLTEQLMWPECCDTLPGTAGNVNSAPAWSFKDVQGDTFGMTQADSVRCLRGF